MVGDDPGFPSEPDFGDGPSSVDFKPFPPPAEKKLEPKARVHFQGRTIVSNQGRIAYMMLPNKFELRNQFENEFCKWWEYMIPRYESMKLAHWLWHKPGSKFSDLVAANFLALLSMEPHVLSDDEMDIVDDVIPLEVYGHNGNFELLSIRTENYGGKNVLVMENKWRDADRKACGLFYPADDSAAYLESIHFEGTDWDYRKTFLSAKAAFLRIKWRD